MKTEIYSLSVFNIHADRIIDLFLGVKFITPDLGINISIKENN